MATKSEQREDARRRLIHSAKWLLVEGGWAGAAVVDIGRGAGMSRGAVNFHFGTKDDLLQEVMRDTAARFGASDGPVRSISELLDHCWIVLTANPMETRVAAALWQEASGPSPTLSATVGTHYVAVLSWLTRNLSALQKLGRVDDARNPTKLARVIATALGGLVLAAGRTPVAATCETYAEVRLTLIRGLTSRAAWDLEARRHEVER